MMLMVQVGVQLAVVDSIAQKRKLPFKISGFTCPLLPIFLPNPSFSDGGVPLASLDILRSYVGCSKV